MWFRMFPTFLGWLLPWTSPVSPAVNRPPLYMEGVYSAFSGIVAKVEVGSPPQLLQVSLSFSEDTHSVLFNPRYCPPFVGGCFQLENSNSVRGESVENIGDYVDTLTLGRLHFREFPFFISNQARGVSLDFRETVGIVGMGKMAKDFSLSISETVNALADDNVVIQMVVPQEDRGIVFQTLPGTRSWILDTGMSIQGHQVPSSMFNGIQFDAGEQGLVFPIQLEPFVRFALGGSQFVWENSQVSANCQSVISVVLGDLSIPSQILFKQGTLWSQLVGNSDQICETRIKISPHATSIVIGRLLTRSVGSVVLNYSARTIRIVPYTRNVVLNSYYDPLPLVDVYEAPIIETRMGVDALIFPRETRLDWTNGFLLLNNLPRLFRLPNGHFANGFLFRRITKSMNPESPVPAFHRLMSGITGYSVRYDIDRAVFLRTGRPGPAELWKLELSDLLAVFLWNPNATDNPVPLPLRFEDFALPDSMLQGVNPEPESTTGEIAFNEPCPVCHEELEPGQTVQGINGCDHRFHQHCLRRWLLTPSASKSCPVCRQVVPTRVRETTTSTTTSTTTILPRGNPIIPRRVVRHAFPI